MQTFAVERREIPNVALQDRSHKGCAKGMKICGKAQAAHGIPEMTMMKIQEQGQHSGKERGYVKIPRGKLFLGTNTQP
jgi:hypothetical protein